MMIHTRGIKDAASRPLGVDLGYSEINFGDLRKDEYVKLNCADLRLVFL